MFLSAKIYARLVWAALILAVILLIFPEGTHVRKVSVGFAEVDIINAEQCVGALFILEWGLLLAIRSFRNKYCRNNWFPTLVVLFVIVVLLFRYHSAVKGSEYALVSKWWLVGFCVVGIIGEIAIVLLVFSLPLLFSGMKTLKRVGMSNRPYIPYQILTAGFWPLVVFVVGVGALIYFYNGPVFLPLVLMTTWIASGVAQEVFGLDKNLCCMIESLRSMSSMWDYYSYPYFLSQNGGWKNKKTEWKLHKSVVANGFGTIDQKVVAKRLKAQAANFDMEGSIISYEKTHRWGKSIYYVQWKSSKGVCNECYIREEEVVKYLDEYMNLYENDIDFPAKNKPSIEITTCLVYAVQSKLLKQRGATLLEWRLAMQDSRDLELLVFLERSINQTLFGGWTLLLYATVVGFSEGVNLLIKYGADVEMTNLLGRTALCYAVLYGDVEITNILLRAGAKVDVKDGLGYTPLMIATESKNEEIVRKLLQYGADVSAKNSSDETALDIAIKSKAGSIASLLRTTHSTGNQ